MEKTQCQIEATDCPKASWESRGWVYGVVGMRMGVQRGRAWGAPVVT